MLCMFLLNHPSVYCQTIDDTIVVDDSTTKIKKGSIFSGRPGKALLFSLVVPGAGQIYNKSYLRVPFVWAAVGGVGYLMVHNTRVYECRRDAYISLIDGNTVTPADHCEEGLEMITDPARMRSLRDNANVNRQWAIVGFTLVWLANGVDAFVDAHLKDFDIDEDISIDIGPHIEDDPFAPMRMGIFVKF